MRKSVIFVLIGIGLLGACTAPPPPDRVVVHRNAAYRCESADAIRKKMLTLVNQARRTKRRCGAKVYPPAGAVRWNSILTKAARRHAADMARSDRLSHTGTSGSTPASRVKGAGYRWRAVGENVAGGQQTCDAVVEDWLKSAAHCANIMETNFTEMGAACHRNASATYGTYWALVLAAPLK